MMWLCALVAMAACGVVCIVDTIRTDSPRWGLWLGAMWGFGMIAIYLRNGW